jgi:hypothetical protein
VTTTTTYIEAPCYMKHYSIFPQGDTTLHHIILETLTNRILKINLSIESFALKVWTVASRRVFCCKGSILAPLIVFQYYKAE